jgi:organic radical activating enzyme
MIKGKIAEVFDSIQGEGLYLGERQIFVRFFGCNLNCRFCDTKMNSFLEYDPEELFNEIKMYRKHYHSISFTGGEPLLQKSFLKEILKLTYKDNFKNYLETNGTLPEALKDVIEYIHIVAMDLKLPSSTGLSNFWDAHRLFLEIASKKEVFIKMVICESTKEEDLVDGLRLINEVAKYSILILQPDSGASSVALDKKLAGFKDICRREKITTCVIPQVHMIAGVK